MWANQEIPVRKYHACSSLVSPLKHFCMHVLWERERERERERFLQTHHPRSSSFEYRSSLLLCSTYVREGRALLQVIKQTAEHLAGGLVLHKEDLAMLINGITNTLNATWSFWLRPAHVYSQEVLERRELRYKKKTHTHTGSIDESLLSSSVTVAFFFFFCTSAILVSPSL